MHTRTDSRGLLQAQNGANPAIFARAQNKPHGKPKQRPPRDRRDPNAMPHIEVCRLGAKASPWSKVPMNAKAKHSARFQMIRAAAEGRPVRPLKQGGQS